MLKYLNNYTLKNYSYSITHQNCTNCFQFETFRCIYEPFTFNLKPLGASLVLYFHLLSYIRLHINNLQPYIYVHQKTMPGANFMHHYLLVNNLWNPTIWPPTHWHALTRISYYFKISYSQSTYLYTIENGAPTSSVLGPYQHRTNIASKSDSFFRWSFYGKIMEHLNGNTSTLLLRICSTNVQSCWCVIAFLIY